MMESKKRKKNQKGWIWVSILLVVVLVFLSSWQFDTSMREAEGVRNEERLQGLANQASLMAERRLQSAIRVLQAAGRTIDQGTDMQSEETMKYLQEIAKENRMDRIGLVDPEGNVVTTNGVTANTKDAEYFKEAMAGNVYISNVFLTRLSTKEGVTISVPVYGENNQVHGVIYGVYLVEEFNIYVNSELQMDSESFVHIIDDKGNYIVKSDSKKCLAKGDKNYFDTLEGLGVDVQDVMRILDKEESVVRSVEKNGETRLLLFSPMQIKNWCVVTVLTGEAATENMEYSRKIVVELITKLLLIIAALICLGYYVLSKERIEIKALNHQLQVKDQIFRIAVRETGGFVFTYHLGTKKLEFMNESKSEHAVFPQEIDNLPKELERCIPKESESYQTLMHLLALIEHGEKKVSGEFCLDVSGRLYYYQVKVTNITFEENGQERIAVGTLVDVTEERQNEVFLKSQIGQDPLTKTYNRLAAMENINRILKSDRKKECAFYIIDLDNFKAVNDTLGHMMGDRALIEVAEIIQRHVRAQDIVCRLGGDEFVVFLVDIPKRVIARNVESLIRKLTITYEADGKSETFSASVGIAIVPDAGTDFQTLYEKADKALYQVKKNGKKGYAIAES